MSTPSTATATHPTHQHYGYPHSSYQATTSYPTSSSNTTAAAAAAAAAAGARLPNPYAYSVPSPTTTTLPYAQPARVPPATSTPSAMASLPSASSAAPSQGSRRKKPDWGEFYKNGLPKEVIVIDDSPGPDASNKSTAATTTATTQPPPPPPHGNTASQYAVSQPAGKRRRTGIDSAYDMGYYDRPSFSINPQQYGETRAQHQHSHPHHNSSNSLSTDRTTSLHTTAPTSLGSQGSSNGANGMYHYEDPSIGQKRKRTTRKSARDEQKRRELETASDAYLSYVPPPQPIVKAKDVPVPVVRDVGTTSYRATIARSYRSVDIGIIGKPRANVIFLSLIDCGFSTRKVRR